MGTFSDILDHFGQELETLGYKLAAETFDVTDVSDAQLNKAFVLLPGAARRSERSIRHIEEEIKVQIAFRKPPAGVAAAKAISAARLGAVWHFLQQTNWGPADSIEWDGSQVLDWDEHIFILELTFSVEYPGLMKPANT